MLRQKRERLLAHSLGFGQAQGIAAAEVVAKRPLQGAAQLLLQAFLLALGLFGPTEWWLYGPWGPRTRTAASNETRGAFAPIEALTVDRVFEAVLDLHDAYIAGRDAPKP